jgi:hypothetical protein
MPDARHFLVTDSAGAPLTGAAAGMTATAFDTTGASRTAPTVVEVGEGVYGVTPTAGDETAGTAVLIDTGATHEPRRVVVACFEADQSNQFWAFVVEDTAGDAWAGAAPTVGSYRSKTGASRTPPTLVALAGAYLYAAVPSAGDVAADTEIRVDGPASSSQPYWYGSTVPIVETQVATFTVPASTGMEPEAVVVRATRDYLLATLPQKTAQLNALRCASLKAAYGGPYVVPSGATLAVSAISREDAGTLVALTSGAAVTATVLAADINTAAPTGLTASADDLGRLVLTSTTAPADGAPSVVVVGADTTGANALFGWEAGGEHVLSRALVAPGWRGVVDGWPVTVPDMGRSFWVLLGDRTSTPIQNEVRRDEWLVSVDVTVMLPSANMDPHRSREGISACVRACRELLTTTEGRYLGRIGGGDVQFATMSKVTMPGKPFAFVEPGGKSVLPGIIFDFATFTLTARVFQRPAS